MNYHSEICSGKKHIPWYEQQGLWNIHDGFDGFFPMFLSSPIRLQLSQGHTKNGEVKPSLLECCLRMVKLAGAKKNGNFVIIALLFFKPFFQHMLFFFGLGEINVVCLSTKTRIQSVFSSRAFFSLWEIRQSSFFVFWQRRYALHLQL